MTSLTALICAAACAGLPWAATAAAWIDTTGTRRLQRWVRSRLLHLLIAYVLCCLGRTSDATMLTTSHACSCVRWCRRNLFLRECRQHGSAKWAHSLSRAAHGHAAWAPADGTGWHVPTARWPCAEEWPQSVSCRPHAHGLDAAWQAHTCQVHASAQPPSAVRIPGLLAAAR